MKIKLTAITLVAIFAWLHWLFTPVHPKISQHSTHSVTQLRYCSK